jgi:pimeloyl-ACP methyl ester carboxylesterase
MLLRCRQTEAAVAALRDGVKLRAMHALPPDARGTIVLIGGRGDFIERYFETMGDLMARGFAVASFDFRGQGGSQRLLSNPLRGHVGSFRDYDEDFRAFITEAVIDKCPRPYYCIAHSTGGSILLRSLTRQRWFTKAVAVSPLIGLLYGAWPKPVVSVVSCGVIFLSRNRRNHGCYAEPDALSPFYPRRNSRCDGSAVGRDRVDAHATGADACDGRTMVGPGNLAIPRSACSRSSLRQSAVVAFVR